MALPQATSTAAKAPPKKAPATTTATVAKKAGTTAKAAPKTGSTTKTGSATKAGSATKTATAGKKSSKSGKKGSAPPAQTWRNRQLNPTASRYKEIQQALADKGYLKAEPTGVWDSQSEDAMKQFQTEKKLQPTGRINAPSLIGLGLGPKAPEPMTTPPALPPPDTPAPAPNR